MPKWTFKAFALIRYSQCLWKQRNNTQHIQILLLGLFYKLMPTLLKQGRVYLVETPLYEVKLKNGQELYWMSEEQKDNWLKENGADEIKTIARSKGLGELDAEVMAATGVDPATRVSTQVVYDEKAKAAIEKWLGTDVNKRKEDILENLEYIVD